MKKLNLLFVQQTLTKRKFKTFTTKDLVSIFKVNARSAEAFLHYNTTKGAFLRLKPGLFAQPNNLSSDFFLANHLYFPSYVSLDSALSFYRIIPESIYSITSITTKSTREFTVTNKTFEYRRIKQEAFTGYIPKKIQGETVYIATPEKALADFLYFVFLGKRELNDRVKLTNISLPKFEQYTNTFKNKHFTLFVKKNINISTNERANK